MTQKSKPTPHAQKKYIRLWLKYRPPHQHTNNGAAIHKNSYRNDKERRRAIARFRNHILNLALKKQIWQARIYDSEMQNPIQVWRAEDQDYN